MTRTDTEKRVAAESLREPAREARALAETLGLEPSRVNYWLVDHDEMNELIAYEGFQHRYPHWRWGLSYERQQKQRQFLGGKAFEIVNNDDPANAFLQVSNAHADQKAVITHVEAHADFFANSEWFADDPDAAATLERHARRIAEHVEDPDTDREAVERWMDNVLCIQDNIDVHGTDPDPDAGEDAPAEVDPLAALDISEAVRRQVFDDDVDEESEEPATVPPEPETDLLAFLERHGKQYDADAGRAVEMDPWQVEVIEILRREAGYFAPQRLTKVMNEGWAAYWESVMMGEEAFADAEEVLDYADHQARVLGSPGFNPYRLGKQLWEYVENTANRREVVEHLLRVEGVTWRNFHDAVDIDAVLAALEPDPAIDAVDPENLDALDDVDPVLVDVDALDRARAGAVDVARFPWKVLSQEALARRHLSLVKPQHRAFLGRVGREELERTARYVVDTDRYPDVGAAVDAVDRTAGWRRMREVRESHNDVTFVDEFLTQEFVDANDYFTYEYSHATGDYRATSTGAEAVKQKLLLRVANLGKPTIAVYDANYRNRNELLLCHEYNGVVLDLQEAKATLRRVFELWGRPVNLKTILKRVPDEERERASRQSREPDPEEYGLLVRYDGEVAHLAATDTDYDTKPDDWL
jgi:stage V sporulation protein R